MTLPTPSTSHITESTVVYPPSEDSYLLLDAFSLYAEQSFLKTLFPPNSPSPFVVELGTGSGVVLAFLTAHAATIFGRRDVVTLGIDVSRTANTVTNETVEKAQAEHAQTSCSFAGSVTSDLTAGLRSRCVDVLVFNPPYVPSEELPSLTPLFEGERSEDYLLSLTFAGGAQGMETTGRLLDNLDDVLSERGVLYLLLCKSNKPEEVIAKLRGNNWVVESVLERRAGWELLSILRISRIP